MKPPMSDAFYENLRDKTAGPLIERYGMPIVMTRTVGGAIDENTGAAGATTTTTYNCFGLIELYDARVIAASLVQAGEKKLLISAKSLTVKPQVGDKFTLYDGVWFIPDGDGFGRIPPVDVLAPGGIALIYTVRIRQ
jgi:hypothetical protein